MINNYCCFVAESRLLHGLHVLLTVGASMCVCRFSRTSSFKTTHGILRVKILQKDAPHTGCSLGVVGGEQVGFGGCEANEDWQAESFLACARDHAIAANVSAIHSWIDALRHLVDSTSDHEAHEPRQPQLSDIAVSNASGIPGHSVTIPSHKRDRLERLARGMIGLMYVSKHLQLVRARLLATILWINHVNGCVWYLIGRAGYYGDIHTDTGTQHCQLSTISNLWSPL
eukprot:5424409-Amphidinium_carterae.1